MPWVCEKTVVVMILFGSWKAQIGRGDALLPKRHEDWIDEDNPVRGIDAFC